MVSSMQRLGFTQSSTIEQKKLAVDLGEVIIKWELQRIKEVQELMQEVNVFRIYWVINHLWTSSFLTVCYQQ